MTEISIPLPIVHHDPKRAKLIVFDPTGLRVGTGPFMSDSSICTLVADGFDEESVQETLWTRGDKGVPTKGHVLWLDRRAELALLDWLMQVEEVETGFGGGVAFSAGDYGGSFVLGPLRDIFGTPSDLTFAPEPVDVRGTVVLVPGLPEGHDKGTLREALAIIVRHYANWPPVTETP